MYQDSPLGDLSKETPPSEPPAKFSMVESGEGRREGPTSIQVARRQNPVDRDITVHSNPNTLMYGTLFKMTRDVICGSRSPDHWMDFVTDCAESGNCTQQELFDKYPKVFFWWTDRNMSPFGKLSKCSPQFTINMDKAMLSGQLDLRWIPENVTSLRLSHNDLTSISLADTRGTSLQFLDVRENMKLNLDLSVFDPERVPLPLKKLQVSPQQVASFFGGLDGMLKKVRKWITKSKLEQLLIWTQNSWKSASGGSLETHESWKFTNDGAYSYRITKNANEMYNERELRDEELTEVQGLKIENLELMRRNRVLQERLDHYRHGLRTLIATDR